MKIAVCVKHVPEGTSHAKIDPQTKRLNRSGEGAINAFDTHAVEEALRIKEAQGGEVVIVTMGPASAQDSVRKALAMGADSALLVTDDAARGLRPRRDDGGARRRARARGSRPRPLRPAGRRLRRRRALGGRRGQASPARDLAGRGADRRGRQGDRQAADRVRLRLDRGAAARRRRRLGRDQRAALPVAEGDHGRTLEASAHGLRVGARGRRGLRRRVGLEDRRPGPERPAAARRHGQDRGRRHRAAEKIVDYLAEKKVL